MDRERDRSQQDGFDLNPWLVRHQDRYDLGDRGNGFCNSIFIVVVHHDEGSDAGHRVAASSQHHFCVKAGDAAYDPSTTWMKKGASIGTVASSGLRVATLMTPLTTGPASMKPRSVLKLTVGMMAASAGGESTVT